MDRGSQRERAAAGVHTSYFPASYEVEKREVGRSNSLKNKGLYNTFPLKHKFQNDQSDGGCSAPADPGQPTPQAATPAPRPGCKLPNTGVRLIFRRPAAELSTGRGTVASRSLLDSAAKLSR